MIQDRWTKQKICMHRGSILAGLKKRHGETLDVVGLDM